MCNWVDIYGDPDYFTRLWIWSAGDENPTAVARHLRSEIAALKLSLEHYRQAADDNKALLDQETEKVSQFATTEFAERSKCRFLMS